MAIKMPSRAPIELKISEVTEKIPPPPQRLGMYAPIIDPAVRPMYIRLFLDTIHCITQDFYRLPGHDIIRAW